MVRAVCLAAVQMCSGVDVAANLRMAGLHVHHAAEAGARAVFLPENFAFMGYREIDRLEIAEREDDGPIQEFVSGLASDCGVWIIAGTIPLRSPDERRCYASCLVFDDRGKIVARYDKSHLFDVSVPGSEEAYTESSTLLAGERLVVCRSPFGIIGLSVCYDLRFSELYRELTRAGAQVLCVPSAFTATTGRAHWRTLTRARAIENLSYVVAPAQGGHHDNGRDTWGHSLIVSPWGQVLAERSDGDGVIIAEIDLEGQEELRRRFPVLDHRRVQPEVRVMGDEI